MKSQTTQYLHPANISRLVCVDERQAMTTLSGELTYDLENPVELPGGTYGLVDAVKKTTGASEVIAWKSVIAARIPLSAHLGPEHSHNKDGKTIRIGPLGCGYASLVEHSPEKVGAPEAVRADHRLVTLSNCHGQIYAVNGIHTIHKVVIVRVEGMSLDSDESTVVENLGILGCDIWAAREYARWIKWANPDLKINVDAFVKHIEKTFTCVAEILAPEIRIEEIK